MPGAIELLLQNAGLGVQTVHSKKGILHIITYVTDCFREEYINIGIIFYEAEGDAPAVTVRLTQDWTRLRCMCPDADISYLEAARRRIASMLTCRSAIEEWIPFFKRPWSNPLEVVDPIGAGARGFQFPWTEFDAEASRLMSIYVDSPSNLARRANNERFYRLAR